MSTPTDQLQRDLHQALKDRDSTRAATLRLLLTDVKNETIASGGDLADEDFVKLVQRGIKRRTEAAEQYRAGDREELAAKEEAEAAILEHYLPPQVDAATLRRAVEEFVSDNDLSGPQAIGQVMKEMMSRFAGQADGAKVSAIAKEILGV